MTWYPLFRRLGRPQGQSRWVQKISPPTGYDPLTFQPVTSHYTDYTFPALCENILAELKKNACRNPMH